MPAPKPIRTVEDADRRIQLFLERAAPIVLDDPQLTADRWQQLSAIATEFELTADEFQTTLDDLVARGVLKRVEGSIPKPPPLPRGRPAADARPVPPIRQPPPTPPARNPVAPPVPPPGPSSELTRDDSHPEIDDRPEPRPEPNPPDVSAKELERPVVTAAQPRPEPPSATPTSSDKTDGRWRVEGAPAPVPARPNKKPHEIYLEFLRQSLAYLEKGAIQPATELRLLQHGVRVLSLSPVYARHLLDQSASELGFHFESPRTSGSHSEVAKEPTRSASWSDQESSRFHADEQENAAEAPDDVSVSSAVKLAEPKLVDSSARNRKNTNTDYTQLERVVPLRDYLHSSLDRVPRGLLPLPLLDKLMEGGVELFGVEPPLVLETIRHVASELRIAVVTRQQAEQHVADFVNDLLDNEVVLTADQLEQVRQSGVHWGLSVAQVDAVVQQLCSAKQAARRREEITTRLALGAAAIAVLLVVSFIGYVFLNARPGRHSFPPGNSQPRVVEPKDEDA